jgi:hypothetical protein
MSALAKPWLSVILPVHNGEKWLPATLDALASQADPGLEIVVIDTSHGPASRTIVESYADRLRLRFVEPAGAEGCMAKTNRGVEQAAADHISWLCQDDLWLPGRTDAVRRWIEQDCAAALHVAPSQIIDHAGRTLGTWRCPLSGGGAIAARDELLTKLLVQNFVPVVTMVVRRDAWLAVGGLDAALWYTADWDLALKLARHGDVRIHDEVTGAFRIHGESATVQGSQARTDFIDQQEIVVQRHIGAVPQHQAARVRALASASMRINADLADASRGRWSALLGAVWTAVRLGPLGLARYLDSSRIVERLVPRIRARLSGAL